MLSVIMPVYNEASTLDAIIEKVMQVPIDKELVIVNDGSSDNTADVLKKYNSNLNIKVVHHAVNSGKGSAIRTGIKHITGDITIIQDGDLETDPNDYIHLIEPIEKGESQVVYGSRLLNLKEVYNKKYYLGGRFVTWITNLLYGLDITDEPTCYKVFDTNLLKSIPLECTGFEFCPEVTAKIAKRKLKIKELPMNYYPRTVNEGKKLQIKDGFIAIWTLLKYKFKN